MYRDSRKYFITVIVRCTRLNSIISCMKLPVTLLGLAAQVPFQTPLHTSSKRMAVTAKPEFAFKEGSDVFSPKDLVSVQPAIQCSTLVSELLSRSS